MCSRESNRSSRSPRRRRRVSGSPAGRLGPRRRTQRDPSRNVERLPLPDGVSNLFTKKTHLGAFLSDRYDTLLRKWDLRKDFFVGILADIESHQVRFANDVVAMNTFVKLHGLPSIIGMVLYQHPRYEGRSYQLTRIAESAMLQTGFTLVPTEGYFRRYNNQNFAVSYWEWHPNEEANQIFAVMLEAELIKRPELKTYRKLGVEVDAGNQPIK